MNKNYDITGNGQVSWYVFALAIVEESVRLGVLNEMSPIEKVSSMGYPQKAIRPAYIVLDAEVSMKTLKLAPTLWRASLIQILSEKRHG